VEEQLYNPWEARKPQWVIVSYREKRIFGGSVKPVFFECEDIWEPESWRVVGEQSSIGAGVVLFMISLILRRKIVTQELAMLRIVASGIRSPTTVPMKIYRVV